MKLSSLLATDTEPTLPAGYEDTWKDRMGGADGRGLNEKASVCQCTTSTFVVRPGKTLDPGGGADPIISHWNIEILVWNIYLTIGLGTAVVSAAMSEDPKDETPAAAGGEDQKAGEQEEPDISLESILYLKFGVGFLSATYRACQVTLFRQSFLLSFVLWVNGWI